MGTIDSKKLNAALARAKGVGLVEQAFTIQDCDIVLRSLRSEDYTAVLRECDGLEDTAYVHQYQKGHIARAIVEINGVDLRDVRHVTVDEPDPNGGAQRKVKLELHKYLLDHMLGTWGKEAIDVAFRKLGDVLDLAERRAKEGITFLTPDETAEERYRRLLIEARIAEKEMPPTLVEKVLSDQGLARKTSPEEIKSAAERIDHLKREQDTDETVPPEASPVEPPVHQAEPEPSVEAEVALEAEPEPEPMPERRFVADPHVTLQQAMAARKLDVPVVRSEPDQPLKTSSRSAQIAALEGESNGSAGVSEAVSLQSGDPSEPVELRRLPVDAQAMGTILDKAPAAGINPRFKPPVRT